MASPPVYLGKQNCIPYCNAIREVSRMPKANRQESVSIFLFLIFSENLYQSLHELTFFIELLQQLWLCRKGIHPCSNGLPDGPPMVGSKYLCISLGSWILQGIPSAWLSGTVNSCQYKSKTSTVTSMSISLLFQLKLPHFYSAKKIHYYFLLRLSIHLHFQ